MDEVPHPNLVVTQFFVAFFGQFAAGDSAAEVDCLNKLAALGAPRSRLDQMATHFAMLRERRNRLSMETSPSNKGKSKPTKAREPTRKKGGGRPMDDEILPDWDAIDGPMDMSADDPEFLAESEETLPEDNALGLDQLYDIQGELLDQLEAIDKLSGTRLTSFVSSLIEANKADPQVVELFGLHRQTPAKLLQHLKSHYEQRLHVIAQAIVQARAL